MSQSGGAMSYPEAYNRVFGSPARRDTRSSYAEQHARRRSPSPGARQAYYSPTPMRPASVLNRPTKQTGSMKNAENLDVQYAKDKDAFNKRANIYRMHSNEKYHHHRPAESIITLWEAGHIVDRGRGSAHRPAPYNPVNPDSQMFDDASNKSSGTNSTARSQSVPNPRASVRPATAHVSSVRVQMGTYDPILHTYTQPPDPQYEAQKEKQFSRDNGLGHASGIAIRVDPVRASFDPITGRVRTEAVAAAMARRPASAPRSSRPEANGSGAPATPQRAAAPAETRAAATLPVETSPTPGHRARVYQGKSWGTYNPLSHDWVVPPQDTRYHDQNQALDQKHGISGTHTRKVEPPRNHGVYNPILNTWVVPPANTRVMAGLSFAPALIFSRAAPGTKP